MRRSGLLLAAVLGAFDPGVIASDDHVAGFVNELIVNDFGDEPDGNPGDGICDIPSGGPPRCSLRAAIMEFNEGPEGGSFRILFEFGPLTINVSGSPLPVIRRTIRIDGYSVPGYVRGDSVLDSPPLVTLNGAALTESGEYGLRFNDRQGGSVRGLSIINFPGDGIQMLDHPFGTIQGNWIGVAPNGTAAGNGRDGVLLGQAWRVRVGEYFVFEDTLEGQGNLISNNGRNGITVDSLSDECEIGSNQIGVNPISSSDMGNLASGIVFEGTGHRIGDYVVTDARASASTGNVVVNNDGAGVFADGGSSFLFNNFISNNSGNGVTVEGFDIQIGADSPLARNLILNNQSHGVRLGDEFRADRTVVDNNLILQNQLSGIEVAMGVDNMIRGNEIVLNADGIRIFGDRTTISSNDIGLIDNVAQGNDFNGVVVSGDNNEVQFNRIGGMGDDGVDVIAGQDNRIVSNQIGMRLNGSTISNSQVGVRVRSGALATTIADNQIGFNFDGVALEGSGTRLCGNDIGIGPNNQNAGNAVEGIRIDGGGNVVGHQASGCAGNRIGFNGSDGVQVTGDANTIRDNISGGLFGADWGNGNSGVFLFDGSDLNDVSGNSLHHNGNDGIRVSVGAGTRNRFDRNRFGENADLSIDLGDDGRDIDDPQDTDLGPNNRQNSPQFTQIGGGGGQLRVDFFVDSNSDSSVYPLTVVFYLVYNDDRQIVPVHRATYTSPGNIREVAFNTSVFNGKVSAMVIDADGNSSELNVPQSFSITPPQDEVFIDRFEVL